MLLTAVIMILLCGVAYAISSRASVPASGNTTQTRPPHEILRSARVSANERIDWEINIGGSEDDAPVSVIRKNNEIYIFGNTSSSDFDFAGADKDKTRGFGARLSLGGSTLAFTVFDFTVAKAIPTKSGFAVAGNEGSVGGLYTLSDSLTVTGKVYMAPIHALKACGLYVYDNRYFLVAESLDETTGCKSLLLQIYTLGLSLEREKLFSHTYSLSLLDLMPYGDGYILAAAAEFQDYGYLTVARFSTISQPAFTDVSLGYKYVPTSFIPLGSGFASVSDRDGNCELLLLTDKFVKSKVEFLTDKPNANGKSLFYAGSVYACTGEKLIELGEDGRRIGSIDFAVKKIADHTSNDSAAFVAGISDKGLKIAYLSKNASEVFSLASVKTNCAVLSASGSGLIAVCDSYGKSADCGDNFGNADVWAVKLKLQ